MCFENGTHVQKTCAEGEIVYINTVTHDWMCGIDDGRCPGAFQVGCDPDPDYSTVPPPPPVNFCNKTKNPLGECCGNRQLWINDGCTTVSFKFGYFTMLMQFNSIIGLLMWWFLWWWCWRVPDRVCRRLLSAGGSPQWRVLAVYQGHRANHLPWQVQHRWVLSVAILINSNRNIHLQNAPVMTLKIVPLETASVMVNWE